MANKPASKNSVQVIVAIFLTGCLNHSVYTSLDSPSASKSPKLNPNTEPESLSVANPEFYLVKPGDTLYSIAFRFGLDFKKLANANEIGTDYRIFEGQSLRLSEVEIKTTSQNSAPQKPVKTTSQITSTSVTKVNSQKNDANAAVKNENQTPVSSWLWPHSGKIVRTFKAGVSTRKGIDISGRIGDSVHAATSGVVVYAGNGLPGYGNLIIIKHAGSLLSAYAFNDEILVKENDQVSSGQKIATMGKQGDQPRLHFEIRRNGKPVNPLGFLPQRSG